MKPAPFRYVRPETLEEVVALLASPQDEAKVLAGGQSLLPLLNLRLVRPTLLIDVALIPELHVLARARQELVIGAGVRQWDAEMSESVGEACALIPKALRYVGYVQTRRRGTIGGSLAHADPASELPAVALALDAAFVAAGPAGSRVIAAREFFHGPFTTALAADEVLTEIRVPIRPRMRYAFRELAHRSSGPALLGVAAGVLLDEGGKVAEARLAAIGLGPTPVRLTTAEQAARDGDLAAAVDDDVARLDGDDYRREAARTLVARAVDEAAA
jgi:carbon-monoxide dehydrogenase medium subunit